MKTISVWGQNKVLLIFLVNPLVKELFGFWEKFLRRIFKLPGNLKPGTHFNPVLLIFKMRLPWMDIYFAVGMLFLRLDNAVISRPTHLPFWFQPVRSHLADL